MDQGKVCFAGLKPITGHYWVPSHSHTYLLDDLKHSVPIKESYLVVNPAEN